MSLDPSFSNIDPAAFNLFGSGALRKHPQQNFSQLMDTGYHRAWDHVPHHQNVLEEKHASANLTQFKDGKMEICLDVHHFGQHDVTVKTLGNVIVIEGRHDERVDDFGLVERYFVRKYPLPKEMETADVRSTLSSDGVLTVTATKKPVKDDEEHRQHREVPIHRTDTVHLSLHNFHETTPGKPLWK